MNLEESNAFSNYQAIARAEYEKEQAEAKKKEREQAEEFIRRYHEYEKLYNDNKELFDKHIDEELLEKLRLVLPNSPYYDMNYMSGLRHGLTSIRNIANMVTNYRKLLKEE